MAFATYEQRAPLTRDRIAASLDPEIQAGLVLRLAEDKDTRKAVLLVKKFLGEEYPAGVSYIGEQKLINEILTLFQTVGMSADQWRDQIPEILNYIKEESQSR